MKVPMLVMWNFSHGCLRLKTAPTFSCYTWISLFYCQFICTLQPFGRTTAPSSWHHAQLLLHYSMAKPMVNTKSCCCVTCACVWTCRKKLDYMLKALNPFPLQVVGQTVKGQTSCKKRPIVKLNLSYLQELSPRTHGWKLAIPRSWWRIWRRD